MCLIPVSACMGDPSCDAAQLLFTLKQLIESFPGEGTTPKLPVVVLECSMVNDRYSGQGRNSSLDPAKPFLPPCILKLCNCIKS